MTAPLFLFLPFVIFFVIIVYVLESTEIPLIGFKVVQQGCIT
jgi:hypothetical protein